MKGIKGAQEGQESPYLRARQEWNERYGDYIKSAHQWRLAAIGSIAVALVAVGGMVSLSMQQKVVPYAVELNGHSEVVRVVRADVMARPTTNQVRASLRSWVIGARTVYVDRRAQQNLLDATYAMTMPDSPAFQTLSNYHRENNPYERTARETAEITVNAIVPVSGETWQVEWTEIVKQRSGKVVDQKAWQGSFTISISPPTDDRQIMINPLGIYVKQFAWTTRL
ncbi:VirB8/TrbF family protein (plasmid) [Nitrosomonas europaea]|uniref:VirB8/TrbF family protein n=1 Tax=Nitrosomonas europaea TaxID=915 RepID=UPI003266E67D